MSADPDQIGLDAATYPESKPLDFLQVIVPPESPHTPGEGAPGVAGHPTFADVKASADWADASVGDVYGPNFATVWFKLGLTVPPEWEGQEVHLRWDCTGEGMLLSEDGVSIQGLTGIRDGTRPGNTRCEYVLGRPVTAADVGRQLTLYIEVACNGLFGVRFDAERTEAAMKFELLLAEIAVFDRAVFDLTQDIALLTEMGEEMGEDSTTGTDALTSLVTVLNILRKGDRDSYEAAREVSQAALSRVGAAGRFEVTAIGHCHIDTAWLWPYRETRRKVRRSWASQLDYISEYPEFKFVVSQAQQFDWLQQDDPELFARVVDAARGPQQNVVPIGGTWVEMDTNLPCGESIARQFMYGQRYFEAAFGERSQIFWLPDTFGYAAQIPQACRNAGIKYFCSQKMSWNTQNRFPRNTFVWEGLDGTELLTHFPPGDTYNAKASVQELLWTESNHINKADSPRALLVYGVGDGGGGPTRPMLERLRRVQDLDGVAKVRHATPLDFFRDVEADAVAAASRLSKGWAEGEIPSTANTIVSALEEEVSKQEAEAEVAVSETAADAMLPPANLSPTAPVGGGLQRWVGELYFECKPKWHAGKEIFPSASNIVANRSPRHVHHAGKDQAGQPPVPGCAPRRGISVRLRGEPLRHPLPLAGARAPLEDRSAQPVSRCHPGLLH